MAIGYSDLKNVVRLPSNWDAGYLQQWRLKDGTTFDQVVQEIGAALVVFNRSLQQGYWANFFQQPTTQPALEYDSGGEGGSELQLVSEYGRPDPLRGDGTGHMLPLKDYGGALGWTYLALRRMIQQRYQRDIRRLIERSQNTWEKRVMERLFKTSVETVGNTGKSVPFADGGTADADYTPPTYEGRTFQSTHNHFLRYAADATGRSSAIKAMASHLFEHGLRSPWDLVIPEVDQASWTAQTEFKKPQRVQIITQAVEVRATVDEETYIGLIETDLGFFRVKTSPRLPTAYAGAFKVLGPGNTQNPLIARYEEGFPLGLALVGRIEEFPLQDAIAYFTFGIGVGNRVGGVATYFAASGNYVDPTIS